MDGIPMPGEFSLYHFNDNATGTSGKTTLQQIETLVWWVVGKNRLWGMIEVLAIKYPFAAGVGRDMGGNANQTTNRYAVDKSALGLIAALKALPRGLATKIETLMRPYTYAWRAEGTIPNSFRTPSATTSPFGGLNVANLAQFIGNLLAGNGASLANEDVAIYADMAPEGRLSMVLSLIENQYAIEIKLIQGQYPLINLFDVYLQAGVEGRASASIHSMASR